MANDLYVSTFYAEAPLISQQEAYDTLRQGLFSHGNWFESHGHTSEEVHVLSCTLDYVVDSKGFY